MEHLIANSGIQFITYEAAFNPEEPILINQRKPLKYDFLDYVDDIEGIHVFDLLYPLPNGKEFVSLQELQEAEGALVFRNTGREELDEKGMVVMQPDFATTFLSVYETGSPDIYSINTLQAYRVKSPTYDQDHQMVAAFDRLLDRWLPMPMFRKEIDGVTSDEPLGWCRVKIQHIGEASERNKQLYRFTWAFDTKTGEEFSSFRPYLAPQDQGKAEFALCNKVDLMLRFLSSDEDFHAFSDYIMSLLGIDPQDQMTQKKYKAYYIYLVNLIRLLGAAPEVTLHENRQRHPVDLVLDIGNSRTCGILFEEGEFTKGKMLALRDLSRPWIEYENKTFDMRVVFRKADFGNDIAYLDPDDPMFQWRSFVRIGEEARRLAYESKSEDGLSNRTTNYSSPKRYLWDNKPFEGKWENLVTVGDADNVRYSSNIFVPGLSQLFDDDGTYNPQQEITVAQTRCHYSRSSLMTFAFIEIFQHALAQINSVKYREHWFDKDVRRYLRNVIITCPTAMPIREQIILRQSAVDAFDAIIHTDNSIERPVITPSPEKLKVTDPYAPTSQKVWKYDEASCCQLTYLYAEISNRYSGEIHKFFDLKGHVRPELKAAGYEGKALTIGTVDIGAGTTDLMICSYQCIGQGATKIIPTPVFWDSFYLAGDDILHNIVQNVIIEGAQHEDSTLGNITSALTVRLLNMTDDELLALPIVDEKSGNLVYINKVQQIVRETNAEVKKAMIRSFASDLIHDFFGVDSAMISVRDRIYRNDFNTQISVSIAQKMLDLLRLHRPTRVYTFDEFFPTIKPADHLLDHFANHFGFRFEELKWRFDPNEISDLIKTTMEPLMKQLAMVLYKYDCDIIVLAGRPTSLDAITELFIKYVPVTPDNLIRLNNYRVGNWFPTADGQGYFFDQKAIVAVGAMVGYLAANNGLQGLVIDFEKMIKQMTSTANYVGLYNSRRKQVENAVLTPKTSNATVRISVFPAFLGCRHLNAPVYQARPLYAIYNHGHSSTIEIRLSRDFLSDRENLTIEDATDEQFNSCRNDLELVQQSLADDGSFWLDKGEFELSIQNLNCQFDNK